FVETTPEEDENFSERLDKTLDHYLQEYNKDKKLDYEKIDKEDVVAKYIHHYPKKDGTLNYKRQFSFRIVYRKKGKNGYILDKNGNYTYDLKYLFQGKIDEVVDYDHPLLEALGVFKNFQYLPDESGSNKTLRATYQTGIKYLETKNLNTKNISHETEKDKKTVTPDKLICSYHAALNLLKDKKEEFDMTKDAMDSKAMELKQKVKLGDGEQDVHEVLTKSDLIDTAQFAVERTYTLQADPTKDLAKEEIKETANIPLPLPVLALGDTKENNIQQMFNKHLENSDKLPTDFKDKNGNVRSIEKEEIRYVGKPSSLVLGIERYKRENPTAETTKITTGITDVDSVTIAKKHIKNATEDTKYSLKGFIFHVGATPNSGHYITYAQNPDGKWVIFDNIKTDANGNFVDYGRVIDTNDTDFDDRKKAAYVYLYEEELKS
nr:hypothetical protein [Candidatus Anoxychlamydiales bacterium]